MQGANEIGGKDKAALENGHHQQVVVAGCGDVTGKFQVSRGNRLRLEDDADVPASDAHVRTCWRDDPAAAPG